MVYFLFCANKLCKYKYRATLVCVGIIDRINYLSYIFSIIYLLPLCAAHGHEKETFAITALCKHSSLPSFWSYY